MTSGSWATREIYCNRNRQLKHIISKSLLKQWTIVSCIKVPRYSIWRTIQPWWDSLDLGLSIFAMLYFANSFWNSASLLVHSSTGLSSWLHIVSSTTRLQECILTTTQMLFLLYTGFLYLSISASRWHSSCMHRCKSSAILLIIHGCTI